MRTLLFLFIISAVGFCENVGQRFNNFFTDLGKGVVKEANQLADQVDRFVADNSDLEYQKRIKDQEAIDAYKRGEINDVQLRTALWLDGYEFQQAIDDRIRDKYVGGNTYPGYYDSTINYYPGVQYDPNYPNQQNQPNQPNQPNQQNHQNYQSGQTYPNNQNNGGYNRYNSPFQVKKEKKA